ncbi:MAG: hydroxyacylglutathione hydrolase [Xanthomonadales bacterium]|nr:hydroxyacylglutathione hydrolase [Xanthomonadales bacterium]
MRTNSADNYPIICPLPAFDDNYIWAVQTSPGHAFVVDPGDATPVLRWLQVNQLQLDSILITHHHMDHIGGVSALVEQTAARVYAPLDNRLAATFHSIDASCTVELDGLSFFVLEVPGHTRSHIAYYSAQSELLFCGDALFSMGCGRMFEGNPAQMLASLDKLAALPDATAIYCTHEYTEANGRFALAVEPGNLALQKRCQQVTELRQLKQATLPVALATEKQTNPFLRCDHAEVIAAAKHRNSSVSNRVDVFATLRSWKDGF